MMDSIRSTAAIFSISIVEWENFFAQNVKGNQDLVRGYLNFVRKLGEVGLPPIFEGAHLRKILGIPPLEFREITEDASRYYRSFSIPKRMGGERQISVPFPVLKHSQRWIDGFILRKIETHNSAHGYRDGRSNITNAKVHLGSREILNLDIKNFFGSIREQKIIEIFERCGYPPNVCFLLARFCTANNCLPQGAPSSPSLSNIAMREVDEAITKYCLGRNLKYSRYVDDITLSGHRVSDRDVDAVSSIISILGLKLNEAKVRFQRGRKKIITGVSIGSGILKLPKAMRRNFHNRAFLATHFARKTIFVEDPIVFERCLGEMNYWLQIEPENRTAQKLHSTLVRLRDEFNVRPPAA